MMIRLVRLCGILRNVINTSIEYVGTFKVHEKSSSKLPENRNASYLKKKKKEKERENETKHLNLTCSLQSKMED